MKRTHQTLLIDETEGELVLVYQLHYRICNLADFLQTTTLQCNNLKKKRYHQRTSFESGLELQIKRIREANNTKGKISWWKSYQYLRILSQHKSVEIVPFSYTLSCKPYTKYYWKITIQKHLTSHIVTFSLNAYHFVLSWTILFQNKYSSLPLSDINFTVEWRKLWCDVFSAVFLEKYNLEISWSSSDIAWLARAASAHVDNPSKTNLDNSGQERKMVRKGLTSLPHSSKFCE